MAFTGPMATAARADDKPATCDPYQDYSCLDAYLGEDFFTRLANYYKLEMGQPGPPSDPNAPPSRRDYWPGTPQTSPPMPFTEWPQGGVTSIGVTRPGSVDSPFMVAMGNTSFGEWLNDRGIQIYGWVDPGGNMSTASVKPGGNWPAAYLYVPNRVDLEQAVIYIDRFPDTVQTDHVDWGIRLSAIYGTNYRYTTSYGVASYQLLKDNDPYGYDFPMVWGELYFPQIAEGSDLRLGRYISIPDTEAQLAPNNYMSTHSITYTFDNYTNEGLIDTTAVTKNLQITAAISVGTEAAVWHEGGMASLTNLYPNTPLTPNPLYPGKKFAKDPGSLPSASFCVRWSSDSGDDTFYPCLDGINKGTWGYNNLQWYGGTYYHKFSDSWHITFEVYDEHENKVPNLRNPLVQTIFANGGTPFSPQFTPFNGPNMAYCKTTTQLDCHAESTGYVSYLNWEHDPLNNVSFRWEFYDDHEGQRTGTRARYVDLGIGWQHWLSPQFEFRPEVTWYRSIGADAFNGNFNASPPIAPNRNYLVEGSMDAILHF